MPALGCGDPVTDEFRAGESPKDVQAVPSALHATKDHASAICGGLQSKDVSREIDGLAKFIRAS